MTSNAVRRLREFSEFAENIRKSFEALIFVEHYPRSTIQLIVTLIQNDGSSKSTILNCITMALINSGVLMRDFLISATVGCYRGTPMLGTDYNSIQTSPPKKDSNLKTNLSCHSSLGSSWSISSSFARQRSTATPLEGSMP